MRCHNHIQKEAIGACVRCGRLFCEDCLVTVNGRYYCKEHVCELINENENTGGYTGVSIVCHDDCAPIYRRSRLIAFLLCLFFGVAGFHRFYTGKIGTGLIWLFTCGCFGIGYILDLIAIIFGYFRDADGYKLH